MDRNDMYFLIGTVLAVASIVIGILFSAKRRTNKVVIRDNKLRDGDIVGGDKIVNDRPRKK